MVEEDLELRYKISLFERKINNLEHAMRELRNELARSDRSPAKISFYTEKDRRLYEMKEQLLGRLTMLLYNEDYFPTPRSLATFVQNQLDIPLAKWVKKYRYHIVGETIDKFMKLEPVKINEIYYTIAALKKRERDIEPNQFFTEWEKTIRELRLKR